MSRHTGRISSFSLSPTGAAMPDVDINGSGFDARQDGGMFTFDESMRSQSTQSSAPYLHVNNMTTPSQNEARRSPTRCPCQRCLVVGLTILVMILLSGLTAATTLLITNNERTAALATTTIGATTNVTAFPNPTATTTTTPTTENTATTYTSGTATPNITKKYPTTTTTSPPATSSSSTTTTPLPTTTAPLSTSTNRPSTVTTSTSTVTTTTTTSKTTTTTPGCSTSWKCHSCTSRDPWCPVNGTMAGTDPVMSCPCTACYSGVRCDDANTVYRGCWRDFPTWHPDAPSNLSCREIDRHFVCFCNEDHCNTHDMTSYIPKCRKPS